MKLFDYDDKCVRITVKDGSVFEGACMYDPAEYCEIEIGVNEECLEICGWLFRKSEIVKVEPIDDTDAFLAAFGAIESQTVMDGADAVESVLLDEDPRNGERLLNCLEHYIAGGEDCIFSERDGFVDVLNTAAGYASTDSVRRRSRELAGMLEAVGDR